MNDDVPLSRLITELHRYPSCSHITNMQLINLDWPLVECVFSALFTELHNNNILDIVLQREKQRRIDSSRDSELEHRQNFTQMLNQELKVLGFNNAIGLSNIQPNLLITNRKLCLKWINYLVDCVEIVRNSNIQDNLLSELPPETEITQNYENIERKYGKSSKNTSGKPPKVAANVKSGVQVSNPTISNDKPNNSASNSAADKGAKVLNKKLTISRKPPVPAQSAAARSVEPLLQNNDENKQTSPSNNNNNDTDANKFIPFHLRPSKYDEDNTFSTNSNINTTTLSESQTEESISNISNSNSVAKSKTNTNSMKKPKTTHNNNNNSSSTTESKQSRTASTISHGPKVISSSADEYKSREELLSELNTVRIEYNDLHNIYNQLINEKSREKHNNRRVLLLKAQNMQLERQVLLLNDAIQARNTVLNESRSVLAHLQNNIQSLIINNNVNSNNDINNQVLKSANSAMKSLISGCDLAQQRIEMANKYNLNLPTKYIKHNHNDNNNSNTTKLSAKELYNGSIGHINLNQIHDLENNLTHLYNYLVKIKKKYLSAVWLVIESQHLHYAMNNNETGINYAEFVKEFDSLISTVQENAHDLLSLAVLLPSKTNNTGNNKHNISSNSDSDKLHELKEKEYLLELELYRGSIKLQRETTQKLIERVTHLMDSFNSQNTGLYGKIVSELDECIVDWQKNSTHNNVNKLLSTMQDLIPSIKDLLKQATGNNNNVDEDDNYNDENQSQVSSNAQSRANLVVKFERGLNRIMNEYKEKMNLISRQQLSIMQKQQQEAAIE